MQEETGDLWPQDRDSRASPRKLVCISPTTSPNGSQVEAAEQFLFDRETDSLTEGFIVPGPMGGSG